MKSKLISNVRPWNGIGEVVSPRLPAGVYVAKLTFVGADKEEDSVFELLDSIGFGQRRKRVPDENFWSQVYGFTVPAHNG